ncbi:hypothetical protein GCM10023196_062790 [Actinoallomurus vinaceus]|uniref:Uncharacterized protein n=1 Tax=Actinoallomurus vinaceus TaxID=1080074 RepID=A0ABP8UHZ4_9ACTN
MADSDGAASCDLLERQYSTHSTPPFPRPCGGRCFAAARSCGCWTFDVTSLPPGANLPVLYQPPTRLRTVPDALSCPYPRTVAFLVRPAGAPLGAPVGAAPRTPEATCG